MELRKLKLYSKNISAQFDFYKNVLGFEVDFFDKNKISISAGKTQLIFEEEKQNQVWFESIINKELVQQILSYGCDIEVLEPPSLKNQINEHVQMMSAYYL